MASPRGYRHLCEIASGGMARVYVAVERGDRSGALFAVKRLHPHLRDDPRARRTLFDEARLAGNVTHPNVLKVHGTGRDTDGPYLAMDYVDGISLAELYSAVKRLDEEMPLQVCVDVTRQIALGLHAVHEQAGGLLVVHRDVSPHNVLIDFAGRARIADFGIAKAAPGSSEDEDRAATSTGVLKGKVGYMAPEQLRFEEPDRRADLFALGVVLYELLAGRRLYHGSDGAEGARRILHEPPPDIMDEREDVPPEIVQLLFVLLAKDPAMRPETALSVAERLGAIQRALAEEEGRTVRLGDYAGSFFERERRERKRRIDDGLVRSRALDEAEPQLGRHATYPPPAPLKWRVKGAAIKATLAYLVAIQGEEGLARIVELCSAPVRLALQTPVMVSNWYDGGVMFELTEAAERLWGDLATYRLAFATGAASADYAFGDGGPYEVFRRQGLKEGIAPFLDTSGEIYRLYYDVGSWMVESVDDRHARMRIGDGVVFAECIAARVAGYLHRGLELVGATMSDSRYHREGDDLVFVCEWSALERPR
tara:strand:+ start:811 stop:2424 length:1614 start_codon:yes stop_codon:yes gene_type:complete